MSWARSISTRSSAASTGASIPAFAALTPTRRVPVLQDGAHTVWESHAILRHLGRRFPAHPLGQGDAGQVDSWLDFGATTLQPSFIGLFYQKVRMTAAERSAAAEAEHRKGVAAGFDVLSRGLADGRPYLAGAELSLADIGIGSMMFRLHDIAPDLVTAAPLVAGWHQRLAARQGFATHIATSYDELRPGGGA